ncbi:sugar O-acetyltransferase [Comamonas koreensis]|uniref:Acetyltransferase n=1 Tax=Comamonas koreensis TaxID=160825 RepID=A0AAW4XSK1_9BURK|nr:sugar O-acetyltransferase [Comamonas koreensis]MCD2163939.1 sugar O-acetyltransferase [Comamonas koreensis]
MTEMEKAAAGLLYDANHDPSVLQLRDAAKEKLFAFQQIGAHRRAEREAVLRGLLGKLGRNPVFDGPFLCDYGFNIEIGDNFYTNVNLVILDAAKVRIGNNVFIAPNVGLYTSGHPLDAGRRNQGLEFALPITIGDNVWMGAGVQVLPGVSIGAGSVIAAGAIVTKDVPEGVVSAGNPARVLRAITDQDRLAYA